MTHTEEYDGWVILVEIHEGERGHVARVSVRQGARNERAPLGIGDARAMASYDEAKAAGFEMGRTWIDRQR